MILESVPAGMILEGPRSDIPDSIRRDMKSQDLVWVPQIGHPGFHTQGHEIPGSQLGYPRSDIPDSIRRDMKSGISHLGHPSWDSGISHKPPWSGKIAFSVNLHQLD